MILFLLWAVMWSWVLISSKTPNNRLSAWPVWPVACGSYGCVSSSTWQKHYQAMTAFSKLADKEKPSREDSLTTLVRQKMVRGEIPGKLVTKDDVKRYREEVLKLTDESLVNENMKLTIDEYDKLVIRPLLEQEALREQLKLNLGKLFANLANSRKVYVLPMGLMWDESKAKATRAN